MCARAREKRGITRRGLGTLVVAGIAPTAAALEDLRRGIETALGCYSLRRERGMEEDGQGYKKGKEWKGIKALTLQSRGGIAPAISGEFTG